MPSRRNSREHPDDTRERKLKAFGLSAANRNSAATVNEVTDSNLTTDEKPLGSGELNAKGLRGKKTLF